MWIAEDAFDSALPLPAGDRELALVIGDRSFNRRNQLTDPFGELAHAPNDETTGNRILVNGAVLPHRRVRAARYRLRILNGSLFRAYNLALPGATITQVGSDGGLLPRPVRRRRVLIGPGERVDLVVDFTGAAHRSVRMKSVPRADGPNRLGSKPYVGPIMEFRVGARARGDRTSVPAELRPLPAWIASAPTTVAHTWRMTVGAGLLPTWLMNGRTFNPARADHAVALGTTERWKLVNATGVAHLFHLHHTMFHLVSRNGRPPAPWEAGLKDTFFMDPGEKLEIVGRFTDHPGNYVVHCHMLDHEDHGLMSQFRTVS
jgi:FtsP/CotA-like multicopper oxidase with cupredoxin domain